MARSHYERTATSIQASNLDPPMTNPDSDERWISQTSYAESHDRILAMCDELESFADALPNRLDQERCVRLADTLVSDLTNCHGVEERCFELVGAGSPHLSVSIRRLQSEHKQDRYLAEDIAGVLAAVDDHRPLENAEAFGFMLRSFFETQRRHIAFEREYILPALVAGDGLAATLPGPPVD